MQTTRENKAIFRLLPLLSDLLCREIFALCRGREGGVSDIRELCIRRGGRCTLLLCGSRLPLAYSPTDREMNDLLLRLVGGAMYAHRDSLARGYLSLEGGIRVGICAAAAYDGGELVGLSSVSSLLFRIPTGECAFASELRRIYREKNPRGLLIYSSPGVGKTTALRALAAILGSGESPLRVAVIDQRGEFCTEDFLGCDVDILRGYSSRDGIEIATRTLSCGVIIIDEIGVRESEELLSVVRCGIPIVATVHAGDFRELCEKPALAGLLSARAFDLAVGIFLSNGKYRLVENKL